jgi:hypothetical protein
MGGIEQAADGRPEFLLGTDGGLAQERLKLGEQLLDRVQIRAVRRQVEKRSAGRGKRLADAVDLVRGEMVEHDDVAGRERLRQGIARHRRVRFSSSRSRDDGTPTTRPPSQPFDATRDRSFIAYALATGADLAASGGGSTLIRRSRIRAPTCRSVSCARARRGSVFDLITVDIVFPSLAPGDVAPTTLVAWFIQGDAAQPSRGLMPLHLR